MTPTLLTPEAKEALRRHVRGLHATLRDQLEKAARSEYRLDVDIDKAELPEARRRRRERLQAWLDEQARSVPLAKGKRPSGKGPQSARQRRFLDVAVREAATTLLHRLVLVRVLEHHGLLAPAVLTGGWKSPAFEHEYKHYAGPLAEDDTEGYRDLLEVVFAELALELPGLFGQVGVSALIPIPAASLRAVVDVLNDPALASAWGDDTTLGWVYQYWNDPDREALDKKIADGDKIEPHEIASKTQMFTERYMVEWLLHNSLGLTWLAICKKNGWQADAEEVLPALEARRAAWRAKREAGEVAPDALMPIEGALEHDWKYFVPQPIPKDAIDKAPSSIRDLKLLDPACGSGHFLVIAFGLLAHLHEEEARHRGEARSPEEIARDIVDKNLHGIDIDPRAIQIAAAALWLRAKLYAPAARLGRLNLVAPVFRLGSLPKEDPALAALTRELSALGLQPELTSQLLEALRGVDHLGTLLRVDRHVASLLDEETEKALGSLFAHAAKQKRGDVEAALGAFLDAHAAEADLGLRLEAEQLAAGLRFMTLAREGTYDVVVGNPPYQGLSKTTQFDYVVKAYPRGKADLYAAFLERGLELVREGGVSAMVTMQGWMFLSQFTELRRWMLEDNSVRTIADMMWCAFESMRHATVAMNVTMRGRQAGDLSVAIAPTPRDEREESMPALARKRAAVLAQVGRHEFDPKGFAVIDGEPIVYWWSKEFLERYAAAPKLGEDHKALNGLSTQNNVRFIRTPTEIRNGQLFLSRSKGRPGNKKWCPYIKGGEGAEWFEPLSWTVAWGEHSGELRVFLDEYQKAKPGGFIKHEGRYFGLGVAFSVIGAGFSARAHRWSSIFGHMGSSIFPEDVPTYLTVMNSRTSREVLQSLNPSVHFLASDVDRLPVFRIANADTIFSTLESAFTEHESHREPSVEFRSPGPSPWRHAQDWAQRSVDRPEGAPLPPYEPQLDPPAPEAAVTFAIGVALGRFGAKGEGILDQAPADALPAGILFVGPHDATEDSLRHPACAPIHAAWAEGQLAITGGTRVSLRDWLRKDLFAHHKGLYENRPIYFPLSSKKKSFVAWVSIHRWADNTLSTLLADHLSPTLRSLDLELTGLNEARATLDKKARAAADKRYDAVKPQRDELAEMIELVKELSQRGAPPTDAECPPRKADAPFVMDLDDGVMINSAALWPLLAPQWADPKKWWKQLCRAENKKDYAWAHLAKRYFPARVDDKCKTDPSLAVAHGCFWRYHPAKAYAWELRLQDEIKPGFTIDEPGSDEARAAFERAHPAEVEAIREKERRRREQRARQAAEGDAEAAGDADGGDADGEDEEAEA